MFFGVYFGFLFISPFLNFGQGQECFFGSESGLCVNSNNSFVCSGFLLPSVCNSTDVHNPHAKALVV